MRPAVELTVIEEGRPHPRVALDGELSVEGDAATRAHATSIYRAIGEQNWAGRISWVSLPRGASPRAWVEALSRVTERGGGLCLASFGKPEFEADGSWLHLERALPRLRRQGLVLVAPVGNTSLSSIDGDQVLIPARSEHVIAVSGVTLEQDTYRAFARNRVNSPRAVAADFCALAHRPDGVGAGTSYAAARVAAALSLLMSGTSPGEWCVDRCRQRLRRLCVQACPDPLGYTLPEDSRVGRSLGYGLIIGENPGLARRAHQATG